MDLSQWGLCGTHLHPPQPQQHGGAPGRREGNEGRGAAKAPRNPRGGSDGRGQRRSCIGSFANLVTQLLVQLAEIHQQRESGSGSGYGQAWWWRELRAHNCLKPATTVPLSPPIALARAGSRRIAGCWFFWYPVSTAEPLYTGGGVPRPACPPLAPRAPLRARASSAHFSRTAARHFLQAQMLASNFGLPDAASERESCRPKQTNKIEQLQW